MNTNLLLADVSLVDELRAKVGEWSGLRPLFNDAQSTAKYAIIEYLLNERGLTAYESRHDATLLDRMDEMFKDVHQQSRQRWCESGMCACMGCINHAAYQNGITKDQWKIWILSRTPGLAEEWAASAAIWAKMRAERK